MNAHPILITGGWQFDTNVMLMKITTSSEISDVFSIFHDGIIDKCVRVDDDTVMHIKIQYLAMRIKSRYTRFTLCLSNIDPNIKSGIIFHLGTPGPLVRNEYTVKCYIKYAGSMVKEAKMKWNSRSSLELSPGDYIIESYVIYFGKIIWKSETEIKIRDEELVNYQFNPPVLGTSKPTIELN